MARCTYSAHSTRFFMRSTLTLGTAAVVLLLGCRAEAQRADDRGWTQLTVNSQTLGKRSVFVVTPDEYERGSTHYPVLVVLDADEDLMFRLVIAQTKYLADNFDGMPEMIVVGIMNGSDRLHDMTPRPVGTSIAEFPTGGGATAFGGFILREVLPA